MSTERAPSHLDPATVATILNGVKARAASLPEPSIRRAIRVTARWREVDVADALHVKRQSVNRWELGHREPRGDLRRRYAELLEVLRRV